MGEVLFALSQGDEQAAKIIMVRVYNILIQDMPTDFIVDLRALCTGELVDRGIDV